MVAVFASLPSTMNCTGASCRPASIRWAKSRGMTRADQGPPRVDGPLQVAVVVDVAAAARNTASRGSGSPARGWPACRSGPRRPAARGPRPASGRSRTAPASAREWRSPCPGCGGRAARGGTPCGPRPRRGESSSRAPPACGCSARSRASISDTKTSSSEGTIFSIRSTRWPRSASAAGGSRRRPAAPSAADHVQALAEQRRLLHRRQALRPPRWPLPAASQTTSSTSSCINSRLERLGRAAGDQLAAIDQPQAVAVLGLVHVVRGDEDRHALRRPSRRSGPRTGGG